VAVAGSPCCPVRAAVAVAARAADRPVREARRPEVGAAEAARRWRVVAGPRQAGVGTRMEAAGPHQAVAGTPAAAGPHQAVVGMPAGAVGPRRAVAGMPAGEAVPSRVRAAVLVGR
jgi:hypothetical protein